MATTDRPYRTRTKKQASALVIDDAKPSKRKRTSSNDDTSVTALIVAESSFPKKQRKAEPKKQAKKEAAKITKGKKAKAKNTEEVALGKAKEIPEKRLKRFRSSCPAAVWDRVNRASTQRMFLVKRTITSPVSQEFAVLGSTGNVYTVKIEHVPSCNCPDATKGHICKHILLVMLKVFRVDRNSPMLYQAAYLTSELLEIFENAAPDPTVVANKKVQAQFEALQNGKKLPEEKAEERRPLDTSDCPICFEEFREADIKNILFCHVCLNNIHTQCFSMWKKSKRGDEVTCVYCRSQWKDVSGKGKHIAGSSKEGYVNLSESAGMSGKRDTSTYRYNSYWDIS